MQRVICLSKPTAIFVLGMHRSGTSALAGALAASGVWLGDDLLEPAPGVNDKGFWEHKELVRTNEALLERAGLHWYSPLAASRFASFETGGVESIEDLRELAVGFARRLLYQAEERGSSVVAIKDPRLCLTAGFWQKVFEDVGARVAGLELVRHPVEVARSLERRDGMVPSHSNVLWLDHLLASVSFCRGLDAAFLGSYDDLMSSPRAFTELAFKELGVPLAPKPGQLERWIQQDLRHHTGTHGGAPGLLGDEVSLLYAEVVQRGSLDNTTTNQLVSRVSAVFEDLESQFQRYNRTVIQLQEVSAKLDELGREHTRALEVVAERDQQIAGANAEKEELIARSADDIATVREQLQNLGDQHHHAQLVVAERDHQLEVLNHRIASFERSLIGKVYRVWSRLRNGISPNRGNNNSEAGQSPSSAMAGVTRFPNSGQRPAVDVIIPVYGGFEETCAAVEAAAGSIDYAWARLVIINDCSPVPEITQWLRENQHRLGYELLENEVNLGFVGTVNRGMRLRPEADVLLLNSDVEVANNWLERLQDCAYSRDKVASVTATANNATICSFPVFCEDNELPRGFDVKRLDEVFAQSVPANMAVEVPTGVGCCMYMRRDSMDEIDLFDEETFGRGYGEENDWCQRAIYRGWVNLHALNVFVYHKGAVSFADESNPRIQDNLKVLDNRYPDYHQQVQEYIGSDPAGGWRLYLYVCLIRKSRKPVLLSISHGLGGGVKTNILEIQSELEYANNLVLEPVDATNVRIYLSPALDKGPGLLFSVESEFELLVKFLKFVGVSHIHFHHTMRLHTKLWALPDELGVKFDYTLHDYWVINGNPTLSDKRGIFAGESDNRDKLSAGHYPLPKDVTAEQWRRNQLVLMEKARYLIAPSYDAALRISSEPTFKSLRSWIVVPHLDYRESDEAVSKIVEKNRPLRVVVLGALSKEKGADLLENVAVSLDKHDIEFHLLGYAYRELHPVIKTHGPYPEAEGLERLRSLEPDVVWFPALWPETYSYTLSLALKGRYPIVAPALGAFVERLSGRGQSVLLDDWKSQQSIHEFWQRVIADPNKLNDAVAPTYLPPEHIVRDDDFYNSKYLNHVDLRVEKNDIDEQVRDKLLGSGQGYGKIQASWRIFLIRLLIKLRSGRFGRVLARMVPFKIQRYVKRRLSEKPIHEILR